ncbi:hypothetical protein ABZ671_30420 [Micromonospora sp. NPDC006766]|uniref:hypothetical protein n=1 Tax=Micromonospora sp. NPDC006766 TaxID=3154778 RepID=UPI003404AE34
MNVDISDSFGFQVGDNNTQEIHLTSPAPSIGTQELVIWWSETWLPFTDPPLVSEIVLAGRQAAAAALRTALSGGKPVIAVYGELSMMEMKAFLAASLLDSPLGQQAVFVGDPAGLAVMLGGTDPRILMLVAGTEPAGLPLTGPHKIVLFGRQAMHPAVTVPAVDGDAVAQLLAATEMERGRAQRCGGLARRGLEQLRHALSRYPECPEASWAVNPSMVCRRLSLLGDFTDEDSDFVAGFTGLRPSELMDQAGYLITDPDLPLLGMLDGRWYVQEPENAFLLLRKSFTTEDLTRFADLAVQVLRAGGEVSGALRRGVSRSLVLLSVHGGGSSAIPTAGLADRVVRELLAGATTADWFALTDVVQLLTEAAPRVLLDALSRSPASHTAMFGSEQIYPPFLWALELLARPTEYFDGAVDVLADLAAVDPGGSLSNRPAASLAGVFDCSYPQTRASRKVRQRALRRLLRTHPAVARALLLELLPHGGVIRTRHPQPYVREWPIPEGTSPSDAYQAFRDVAALAIGDAGTDPSRCADLVPKIDAMPTEEMRVFTQLLDDLVVTDVVPRRRLFEALQEVVTRHQQFADESWALPPKDVGELARIANSFSPERAVDRHRWLFTDRWPSRAGYAVDGGAGLARSRVDAVKEILNEEGLDALLVLADETGNGDLIGDVLPQQDDEGQLMSWLTGDRGPLAFAYFAARMREDEGRRRTELLGRAHDPSRRAAILLASRDPQWAWKQLRTLDAPTSEAYWLKFPTFGLGVDFDSVAEAAAGLNSVGRFAAALDLISIYSARVESADIAAQAVVACEGFARSRDADPEAHIVSTHDLQIMIDILARYRETVDRRRIIAIELNFSTRIGSLETTLPATTELLVQNPAFFTELAVTSLRGDSREARTAAHRALDAVIRCPGSDPNGAITFGSVHDWVEKARALFAAYDLQKIGDEMIASVLVHAVPSAIDEIGEILEEIGSDDLDRGLWVALYNRRGLTCRRLSDGGTQERRIADQYRDFARQADDHPRMRRILDALVKRYEQEGTQQDAEAERYRRHL